jgi:uncharacterized protein YegL
MGLDNFTTRDARPLPVIVLTDTSGSMSQHGKIDTLNRSMREMLDVFEETEATKAAIHVSVVRFGGGTEVHTELAPVEQVDWEDLPASGRTPMGRAFDQTREMVENREIIESRGYRPVLILVSDGIPTDDWRDSLDDLLEAERASKADRLALGIGPDSDECVLRKFVKNSVERGVLQADDVADIPEFFQLVTMSVQQRMQSQNPDDSIDDVTDPEDWDF